MINKYMKRTVVLYYTAGSFESSILCLVEDRSLTLEPSKS